MLIVEKGECSWVQKQGSSLFKTDFMLALVGGRFFRIPFEVEFHYAILYYNDAVVICFPRDYGRISRRTPKGTGTFLRSKNEPVPGHHCVRLRLAIRPE